VKNKFENRLPLLMLEEKILNYTELAVLSGIKCQKIHDFAKNNINFETAQDLCNFFECSLDKLLKVVDEKVVDYSGYISYKDNRSGIVYFLQGDNGLVKIGRTNSLEARMKTILYNDKIKTTLINYIATYDTPVVEKSFHSLFSDKNVHGEWYRLTKSDIETIKSL
jgi:DNA-binding Xre family transcriptional regulator